MAWIDSHCHLDDSQFDADLKQVIQAAQQQGIQQFIIPSIGVLRWEKQQQLKKRYPFIFNAFGIHPWFCETHEPVHLEQLDDVLENAVAIGECGLDFSANKAKPDKQLGWFEAQLSLAVKHGLPLIIHSVQAGDAVVACLKKYSPTQGVVHGFSGSLQQAQTLMRLGFYIGIGTRILNTQAKKMRALAADLPLTSLLLETDAPDGLTHGQRNQPSNLVHVAEEIAKLRHQDSNYILQLCSQNARELFQI